MTKGAPSHWDSLRKQEEGKMLLLINDDINTFDHGIKSLVEVCGHDELQAEQCALLTHYTGSCVVKIGDADTLAQLSEKLQKLKLDTIIQ